MKTDIFISYRQEGAADLAQLIYLALNNEGYRVFLDKHGLGSGEYGKKLLSKIRECNDFLLILPPHALDRCKAEDDWVRMEVECALEENKRIIPVWMPGFDGWPEDLPESMARLRDFNALHYYRDYVPELIAKLKSPDFLRSAPNEAFAPNRKNLPAEYCESAEGLIYVKDHFHCPHCGSRMLRRKDGKDTAILLMDSIRKGLFDLLVASAVIILFAGVMILSEPQLREWLETLILNIPYIARDYFQTDSPFDNWWKILLVIYAAIALVAMVIIYCADGIRDPVYDKELAEGPHTVGCICKNCKTEFWAISSEKLMKDWTPEEQ